MYLAMTALGHAETSSYAGPLQLDGDPRGARVLVLGAGVAGMVATMELRRAGYQVELLEYNDRVGGRTWTLRGGDRFTEMGGAVQECGFDPGLYLNPGPWRIPYHHRGLLDYCRRLGVALEPFIQVNHNAYLHATAAFGGKPQRYRTVQADFHGTVADMLAKAVRTDHLAAGVTPEDTELLLAALRSWGALDADYRYRAGRDASEHRGWDRPPGGGVDGRPVPSAPVAPADLLQSPAMARAGDRRRLRLPDHAVPAGRRHGRDRARDGPRGGAGAAAAHQGHRDRAGRRRRHRAWQDTASGAPAQSRADWCVCAIPLSVLSQVALHVSPGDGPGDRRRALRRRGSRSACSSAAGSGRRTRRSTAASATPTCRSR